MEDRPYHEHDMFGSDWYIEICCLVHKVTKVGLGLFYKCDQNDLTKKVFESAKEKGIRDNGDEFILLLKKSDNPYDIHDKVQMVLSQT